MDFCIKLEVLADYINDTFGKYFRYFIKNHIDPDDDSHPLAKNYHILADWTFHKWYTFETDEEIEDIEKQVDEMDKYFTEYTRQESENSETENT